MRCLTQELSGRSLDWAVAKCRGYIPTKREKHAWGFTHVPAPEKVYSRMLINAKGHTMNFCNFHPSTDWEQGDPIVEQELFRVFRNVGGTFTAQVKVKVYYYSPTYAADVAREEILSASSPTLLVAAMRCFCCAKLGDEVEVPETLI